MMGRWNPILSILMQRPWESSDIVLHYVTVAGVTMDWWNIKCSRCSRWRVPWASNSWVLTYSCIYNWVGIVLLWVRLNMMGRWNIKCSIEVLSNNPGFSEDNNGKTWDPTSVVMTLFHTQHTHDKSINPFSLFNHDFLSTVLRRACFTLSPVLHILPLHRFSSLHRRFIGRLHSSLLIVQYGRRQTTSLISSEPGCRMCCSRRK